MLYAAAISIINMTCCACIMRIEAKLHAECPALLDMVLLAPHMHASPDVVVASICMHFVSICKREQMMDDVILLCFDKAFALARS